MIAHIASQTTSARPTGTVSVQSAGPSGVTNRVTALLTMRVRLGLARDYIRDLAADIDFGRVVDSRGSSFGSSREKWIERVKRIAGEAMEILPDDAADILARLDVVLAS